MRIVFVEARVHEALPSAEVDPFDSPGTSLRTLDARRSDAYLADRSAIRWRAHRDRDLFRTGSDAGASCEGARSGSSDLARRCGVGSRAAPLRNRHDPAAPVRSSGGRSGFGRGRFGSVLPVIPRTGRPAIAHDPISGVEGTSLATAIPVVEPGFAAHRIDAETLRVTEARLVASALYLSLSRALALLLRLVEWRCAPIRLGNAASGASSPRRVTCSRTARS